MKKLKEPGHLFILYVSHAAGSTRFDVMEDHDMYELQLVDWLLEISGVKIILCGKSLSHHV